jgi:hypothetical protein BACCOPRO_03032
MKNRLTYLDTYVVQQDMRIRLPKCILENLEIEKGKSMFDIYLDSDNNNLVFKIHESRIEENRGEIR